MAIQLVVNGARADVEVEGDTPMLWVLRDVIGLTGTKYGCGVALCGYCQCGQLMSAAALLAANPAPTGPDIDLVMSGNICRCGTYGRIRAGIKKAAEYLAASGNATTGRQG